MRILATIVFALSICSPEFVHSDEPRIAVIVVVGASGEEEFGKQFRAWAARWEAAAKTAKADYSAIGLEETVQPDRELLESRLVTLAKDQSNVESVWLVLIGHGTFDGKTARFGLRGPDIKPAELAAWLKPIAKPVAVIDCTSSSGPFVNELSARGRAVVTASRSGFEFNFARFGDYFSSAIADPKADLDKDDQTSLLEAFLAAAAGVKEFYLSDGRLVTEHALMDDNGDQLGTPADWFQGLRATKSAKEGAALDGILAGQMVLVKSAREERLSATARARRDELERELAEFRLRKAKMPESEYLEKLEPILLELARLYQNADAKLDTNP